MTNTLSTFALLLASLVVLVPRARADDAACGGISDTDYRYLCYARVERRPADCGAISSTDLRYYCYAVSDNSPADCGAISDPNLRGMCYGEAS